MKTAKQFLHEKGYADPKYILVTGNEVITNMVEFAKLHVKAALEAASERNGKYFILNSYPETNIK